MYKVGITGGIGSGKSTVARIFESIGIPVYYADKEAKRLMNKNQSLKQDIRILLSNQAYHKNGRLNRKYIAERVFKDKALLEQLNNLVHPAVRNDFESWAELQESSYVLEESALVFEIEGQSYFDATILVIADKETRIERVIKRDKSNRNAVIDRMNNQLSDEIKIPLADHIVSNNGDKSLIEQVLKIHRQLIKNT
jgi:dephospho-CoA kinase